MKDVFSENNYTKSDVAKGWFKKHWMSSSSANQNSNTTVLRRKLMTGGAGGYGAPAVIQYVEVQTDSKEESAS